MPGPSKLLLTTASLRYTKIGKPPSYSRFLDSIWQIPENRAALQFTQKSEVDAVYENKLRELNIDAQRHLNEVCIDSTEDC